MGLTNLSPRDTVLIIIVVNLLCYFLGYRFILSPLIAAYNNTNEARNVALQEYNDLKYEAEQEVVYDNQISELNKERRDEINSKFYQTVTAEKFHKWFTNLKTSQEINLTNFEIKRVTTMVKDEEGNDVEADFVDNQVSLNFTSTYQQLIGLLQEIENDGKASVLTDLSITPTGGVVDTRLTYSFYSITKKDGEDSSFNSTSLELGTYSPNPENQIGSVSLATG